MAQTLDSEVRFAIAPNTRCGAPLGLHYHGAVDSVAYSMRSRSLLETSVGGGGPCNPSNCTVTAPAQIVARAGHYANLSHGGNGMATLVEPQGNSAVFAGAWFTGNRDRTPTWLIFSGNLRDNQARADVYRLRRIGSEAFQTRRNVVGQGHATWTAPTQYIATWMVDGIAAGGKFSLITGLSKPNPNRTGSWYYPAESGWGISIDDHFVGTASEQTIINYLFDAGGNPVWTLGFSGNRDGTTMPQMAYFVQCPTCPRLSDYLSQARPAGDITVSYSGLSSGTYSTRIELPSPLAGSWRRDQLPIIMISSPQVQQ